MPESSQKSFGYKCKCSLFESKEKHFFASPCDDKLAATINLTYPTAGCQQPPCCETLLEHFLWYAILLLLSWHSHELFFASVYESSLMALFISSGFSCTAIWDFNSLFTLAPTKISRTSLDAQGHASINRKYNTINASLQTQWQFDHRCGSKWLLLSPAVAMTVFLFSAPRSLWQKFSNVKGQSTAVLASSTWVKIRTWCTNILGPALPSVAAAASVLGESVQTLKIAAETPWVFRSCMGWNWNTQKGEGNVWEFFSAHFI